MPPSFRPSLRRRNVGRWLYLLTLTAAAHTACTPIIPAPNPPLANDEEAVRLAAEQLAAALEPGPPYMYRETSFHTGQARTGESLHTELERVWTFSGVNVGIHSASKSSPIADEQRVYVGADSGHLYALDKFTGELLWQWTARPSGNGIHATPAVDESRVYIANYSGWLSALDKITGELVWETDLGDSIGASPVIVGDRIYAGVETRQPNGYLAIVDRAGGAQLRTSARFGDHTHCTPTVDPQLGRVYLGSNHGQFHCLDADDARELWRFTVRGAALDFPDSLSRPSIHGQIKSTAALVEQRVLFTSWDDRLYCLDAGNGAELWSFLAGSRCMSSPAVDPVQRRVYFGSHDARIYAIDFDTGEHVWDFVAAARVYSSPVIVPRTDGAGNVIVIGSSDAHAYMLDGDTGESLWQARLDGAITSVPLVSDHRLYIATDGGDLVCWE